MVTVESPAQHRLQSASVSLRPNIAYVATQSVNGGPPTTIYFDHGKYALFNLDTFYLYDGTDTFLRWDGNRKAHTAQLDTPLALNRLYKMIQHEGVHITSQKSGIAPSLLQHFARLWIPGLQPRVLSYPLQVFAQGQRDFPLREYTRSGTEKVCRLSVRCVGLSKRLP